MAQITWMNVPIPSLDGEQQGIRTAADLLKQATASATGVVGEFQGLQEAEKAAQVKAADRFVFENMMSTQDPRTYQRMVADGSMLGPAADKVSSSTLLAMDQRANQLYTLDRERTADREMAAAMPFFKAAAREATNNPDLAQDLLSMVPITDARRAGPLTEEIRKLYVPPDHEGSARKKREELERKAGDLANRLFAKADDWEGASTELYNEPDTLVQQLALDLYTKRGGKTENFYGTNPTPNDAGPVRVIDGPQGALSRQFGGNEKFVARAAKNGNYFPGSPEWMYQNGNRPPTMGDVHDFQEKYIKPLSKEERAKDGKEPTTAVGPAQVVNSTRRDFISRYGQRLFGTTDMNKIPYTLENEEKLAGAIYDEQLIKNKDPMAWQATQKYNSLKDLKAFEGKTFDEAKPLLYYIDGGVAPASYKKEVKQLEVKLQEKGRELSEGARVILNAEPNAGWGLAQASEELAKSLGKEVRPGEVRELVESTVRKAKEAGTTVTYAEAVELIKNSISDDGNLISTGIFAGKLPTISDLADDLDLEESKLVQSAKDLGKARVDLETYKKNTEALKKVQELSKKYEEDQAAARSQLTKAKERGATNGVATINAFRRWQSTSDQLAKLVAGNPSSAVSKSLADEISPPAQQAEPQDPGVPYIDLMSEPKPRPKPPAPSPVKRGSKNG